MLSESMRCNFVLEHFINLSRGLAPDLWEDKVSNYAGDDASGSKASKSQL